MMISGAVSTHGVANQTRRGAVVEGLAVLPIAAGWSLACEGAVISAGRAQRTTWR